MCVCVGGGVEEPSGTLVASKTSSAITTEMASQSQGIQQLLQAEKRAAEKVADARKRKARRLKQATRRQVQGMQSSQQRNQERVLAQLLGMVCDVRPQVHPNYRIAV
ncbi:V-type proton ATPase subunit G 2 isoform X2 [Enhydra lutris kenyoni]|uniref:V-type proton ATPase subunit G 2 isoform X2 n=1 Tax=Enhydra lutris kenyoni TaxID=391180 RepID=A0A2Y9JZH4_ENHLU|nr:V-type proton ATPase subunit G 2 isoform X2 [Enhydra lutris kenyoni]